MVVVAKYFRYFPHLKSLNVSENKLDLADCQVLNIALDTTTSLEKLSIARCITKPDLIIPLLNSLVGNQGLTGLSLDLSKNKLEEREVQPLCQVFLFFPFFSSLVLNLSSIRRFLMGHNQLFHWI